MLLKGLDNGYEYTKSIGFNERTIFKSAYSTKVIDGTPHINIDGVDYYVGAGNMVSQPDKTDHEINKICTLTNLAMTGNNEYYLVVGLPIAQCKQQKDKFISTIMRYNNSKVIYHNQNMDIKIKDVTVYPQGAAALYAINRIDGEFVLIDFGGYTFDVAWIEMINGSPVIKRYDTWYKGISTLYSKIIEEVNLRNNLTLKPKDAEKIVVNGLKFDGEKKDISYLQDVYDSFLNELFIDIEKIYPIHTVDTYLFGGGAKVFYQTFKKYYPHTELVADYQFANATGYYKIGLQKYYKYIVTLSGR